MNTQLLVKRPADTAYTDVDLLDDVPYSITYSVADIRQPDKRSGSFSKTIEIPGSATNNKLFEFIFNVNIATATFNPNLKCDAVLLQNGVEIFRGSLRLAQIHVFEKTQITYDIELYGNTKSIFDAMGNKYITDLDLSAYNHLRTAANIVASWTAPSSNGYVYPLINNGLDAPLGAYPAWRTLNMYPCFYVKAVMDEIFAEAGYTYTSNFFSSSLYSKLIVTGSQKITAHSAQQSLRITIGNCKFYQVYGGSYINATAGFLMGYIRVYKANGLTGAITYLSNVPFYGNGYNSTITIPATDMEPGDLMQCRIDTDFQIKFDVTNLSWSVTYDDGTGTFSATNVSTHTYTCMAYSSTVLDFTAKTDPNAVFDLLTDTHTAPALNAANYLPDKILQKDFVMGIVKMFNLFVEVDKSKSNNLLIETRNDYYAAGGVKDWTAKWAIDQETQVTPMGDLNTRQFYFHYKEDKDFYNNLYTNGDSINGQSYRGWAEIFGEKKQDVTSDFQTQVLEIVPVFSPTIIAATGNTYIPVPQIITKQPSTAPKNNFKGNIRILIYGGMKTTATWKLIDETGTVTTETSYPYAGMVDDTQAPTIDLCFGMPRQVFYTMITPSNYTTNNLYNAYWSQDITERTDRDSKIVTAWFWLTPADIQLLDFRDTIKVNEQYYHINKVEEYCPNATTLTKVELTKLTAAVPFSPSVTSIHSTSPGTSRILGSLSNTAPNANTGGVLISGGKNAFDSVNAIVISGGRS